MAKVIEFYVPEHFRKPHRWAPGLQVGKVIEFDSHMKQSAFLWLELSLACEQGVSETPHGVDLDHARS
jgi:hypothetical protein